MITKEVTGYNWLTQQEADSANEELNTALGLPVFEDSKTTESIRPIVNCDEDETVIFYFIHQDDSFIPTLGDPITFEVNLGKIPV